MITTLSSVTALSPAKLLSKLDEIAVHIEAHYALEKTCGGLTGRSGLASFMFQYARYTDNDHFAVIGQDILNHTIDTALDPPVIYTYCSGLAGLGWTLEFLKEYQFIDIDTDHLLTDIDTHLFQKMIHDLEANYYDTLHGGLGYFLYFIKRQQNTTSIQLKKTYTTFLEKGLELLESKSVKQGDSIYWLSTLPPKNDHWIVNTGLSHGLAGILSILASATQVEAIKPKAIMLLHKAIAFLITIKNPKEMLGVYPTWMDPIKKDQPHHGRTAWCYGDLGIALTFLKISKIDGFNYLKDEAVTLLDTNMAMNAQEQSRVDDAGFCHGAFGVAHCYGIAYAALGCIRFKEEQDRWMQTAFTMEREGAPYAGFPMYLGKDNIWEPRLSLLEGIAGIGLVLIDYLSGKRGNWDEALLLG